MTTHPFWAREADRFSPEEAVERFVPNRVWDEIRNPDNRLLIGGVGTGKSIVLKRLSWPAMKQEPAFLPGRQFFGVYVDVRYLDCLDPLHDSIPNPKSPSQDQAGTTYDRLTSYAAAVVLAHSVFDSILDPVRGAPEVYLDPTASFNSAVRAIQQVFGKISDQEYLGQDPSAVLSALLGEVREFVSGNVPRRLEDTRDLPTLENVAHGLSIAIRENLPKDWKLVYLIDQYESIHPGVRRVFNRLLRRTNRISFNTIIASRPFAFELRSPESGLIPSEDFLISLVEYLPAEDVQYRRLLKEIVAKLADAAGGAGVTIEGILPSKPPLSVRQKKDYKRHFNFVMSEVGLLDNLFGFENIARLSSASIRSFFNICRECVLAATESEVRWQRGIPPVTQLLGVAQAAKTEVARIGALPSDPKGAILKAVFAVRDKARLDAQGATAHMPEAVHYVVDDLFGLDPGSAEAGILFRAFEDSAFQFGAARDVGFLLPQQWRLQSLLAPALKLDLRPKGVVQLGKNDFEKLTSVPIGRQAFLSDTIPGSELTRVFLSTSFSLTKDRVKLLEDCFRAKEIKLEIGRVYGPGQLESVRKQILSTQMTLVDITERRPNVIFEMGLSLAAKHPVVPLVDKESIDRGLDITMDPILKYQGHVAYSWREEEMASARDTVIRHWERPKEPYELLLKGMYRRQKLRLAQPRQRSLFLLWPSCMTDRFGRMMPRLLSVVRRKGFKVHFLDDAPEGLEEAEAIVWGCSRASHVLVDTTPPALEETVESRCSFALGFAYGERRASDIVRTEFERYANAQQLSMWSTSRQRYMIWGTFEDLAEFLEAWLPGKRRGGGRKKGRRRR